MCPGCSLFIGNLRQKLQRRSDESFPALLGRPRRTNTERLDGGKVLRQRSVMSEKRRGLLAAVAAACVAALVAAGCGGSTQSKAGGGICASGAGLVTADALAYVSVDSNLSSSRWQ